MRSANLLYLANSGEIFGGGQISLLNLLAKLDRGQFRPLVICPFKGSLVDELKRMDIETRIVKMETLRRLNIFSWMTTINRLIRLIKRKKIDLIHSNGSRVTIYGGIAARLTSTRLIWHARVADRDRLLDKLLSRLATKIIVISKAVSKRFAWLKDKEKKIIVIYNGIDLRRFNPNLNGNEIRDEFNIAAGIHFVGIVGQLIPWKGHHYFLEAAARVVQKIPQAKFLIVGKDIVRGGEYKKELESLAERLGIREKVIFASFRRDIPRIMASLDLFVLTSEKEHFGRVLVEAMACAKPVIAANAGGVPEIVKDGETGILVPPKDPEAMAEAIVTLLRDKKKAQRMGQAGRKRAEKMFSIEENVRKTEKLYEKILTRKI